MENDIETAVVYLDADFRCYSEAGEGRREVETDAFIGMTPSEIERFRYVPEGETWTRADGSVFRGVMVSLAEETNELEDMRAALALLGVSE